MRCGAILVFLALVSIPASALPSRVFAKSTGMDVGACPITAPCRSFSYAITQVAASGEVIALDTAGYGTFVVTQSVSVFAAPGTTAFIAVSSGTGIMIDSPVSPTDVIVLRGLALTGTGGDVGIQFVKGHSLAIENCIFNGFGMQGLLVPRNTDVTSPSVRIEHSTFRNNLEGIEIFNVGPGIPSVGMTISNCLFVSNGIRGIDAEDNARVVVTDTVLSNNGSGADALAGADNSMVQLDLERCSITGNTYGLGVGNGGQVQTLRAVARIAHNVITGNGTGVLELAGGQIMTMISNGVSTNTIEGNVTDGTFSGSYTAK